MRKRSCELVLAVLLMLLPGGFSVLSAADSPDGLLSAARSGDVRNLKRLIEQGADTNATDKKGMTALMHACSLGNAEVVGVLLKNGASVDAKTKQGLTVFHFASKSGSQAIFQLLVDHSRRTHWGEAIVTKVDIQNKCLPVRIAPGDSFDEVGCVKIDEKVRLNGIWSDKGWAQIYKPVLGWIPPGHITTDSLPKEKRLEMTLKTRPAEGATSSPE